MPMDWNQDHLSTEAGGRAKKMNERLSMIEQKMAQPQKLLTVKEVAQFLEVLKKEQLDITLMTHKKFPT